MLLHSKHFRNKNVNTLDCIRIYLRSFSSYFTLPFDFLRSLKYKTIDVMYVKCLDMRANVVLSNVYL